MSTRASSPPATLTTCPPSARRSSRRSARASTRRRPAASAPARSRRHQVPPAAILDIDGTLVDTNYQHAVAWFRAFRQHGVVMPCWRIHRHVGMGGDQLVAALAGEEFDEEHGDDVRAAETALYLSLIPEVEPLEGARELIEELKRSGHAV